MYNQAYDYAKYKHDVSWKCEILCLDYQSDLIPYESSSKLDTHTQNLI